MLDLEAAFFEIAGIRIRFTAAGDEVQLKLPDRYTEFVTSRGDPDLTLQVLAGRPDFWPELCVPLVPGFLEYGFHQGQLVLMGYHGRSDRLSHVVCLSGDLKTGALYLVPDQGQLDEHLLRYPLDMVLFAYLLRQKGGGIFHGSAVDAAGGGLLFLGHSGAGKSTLAKLWQARGRQVLNDDRVIVRLHQDGYHLHGTPWPMTNQELSAASLPLERIYVVQHGSHNQARPLSPAQAVSRFMVHSLATYWDPAGVQTSLAFFEQLALRIPTAELAFVPEPAVVDFLQ